MSELDLDALVGIQENKATLLRFEDATDDQVPRLNYSVPLPGSIQGRYYLETHFGELPWKDAAFRKSLPKPHPKASTDKIRSGSPSDTPPPLDSFARVGAAARAVLASGAIPPGKREGRSGAGAAVSSQGWLQRDGQWLLSLPGLELPYAEILEKEQQGKRLVLYCSLGGAMRAAYTDKTAPEAPANPRFVVIEHYRLSSFLGDYGAGKTVSVFSLMPGEETKLYIRNWRRSEQKKKEASTIFDSFTQEAADDFESTLESETTDQEGYDKSKEWSVDAHASAHLGFGRIASVDVSVNTSVSGSTHSSRQQMAKAVDKSTQHHASKASGKRENTVSTEIDVTETQEFESITERTVKNTNLSRTLNVVARELNQEFTTYLSLVDVTVAFANDHDVFEEFALHELDDMLKKYLPHSHLEDLGLEQGPYNKVRKALLAQMGTVYDFQGTKQSFFEVVPVGKGGIYRRVRRSHSPDEPNPFYEPGMVPVEGVVLSVQRHTIRTDGLIIDSLLGQGVALDNYALGLQQEALRRQQLENRKLEIALGLIETPNAESLEAYRSLFGSVDEELLEKVALKE